MLYAFSIRQQHNFILHSQHHAPQWHETHLMERKKTCLKKKEQDQVFLFKKDRLRIFFFFFFGELYAKTERIMMVILRWKSR